MKLCIRFSFFSDLLQLFNQTISHQVGESGAAARIKSSSRRSLRCGLPPLPAEGLPARDEGDLGGGGGGEAEGCRQAWEDC